MDSDYENRTLSKKYFNIKKPHVHRELGSELKRDLFHANLFFPPSFFADEHPSLLIVDGAKLPKNPRLICYYCRICPAKNPRGRSDCALSTEEGTDPSSREKN